MGLPDEFSPAAAFRRALDAILHPGDVAAPDLGFSTRIVDVLESAAKALADGARHAASASAGHDRR